MPNREDNGRELRAAGVKAKATIKLSEEQRRTLARQLDLDSKDIDLGTITVLRADVQHVGEVNRGLTGRGDAVAHCVVVMS